ncbi:MAG: DUF5110 domain-containing protein [Victivallales bacterium]|nr:DUF5110 domain-containing protein [Victivallales bacterium]
MNTYLTSTGCGYQVAVRFLTDSMVRIQVFPRYAEFSDSGLNRYHFLTEPDQAGAIQVQEEAGEHRWRSCELTVSCDEQARISCCDASGKPLFAMNSVKLTRKAAFASFQAQPEEDWVGFGDVTRTRLFHRGHKAVCWVSNVVSYLPVPFFMSTEGYSILVNTTHCVVFDMCESEPDVFSWKDERAVLDFYVFRSLTFKEGIRQYTDLSGHPKLPPDWAFGLWYICRTQANDAEIVNDAFCFRREKIPCDLIGLEPGWMDKDYDASLDKKWNPKLFALTDWQKKGEHTFIKALQRMGYHLELWICNEYDLSYEEERKISAELEPDDRPGPAFSELADMDEHFLWPRRMDQITKPEEPWFEHLKQFVDWGADFFKQDGAWQICAHPDRLYGNGMTDAEMHNLYPLLYSRQMWEGFAQYKNRRPVVFTPSGWSGFQSWCGTWTGDTGGRLETLGAMLNTSMLGHSWATNDMEVMQPEGIHFGYLQPWSQINSWTYFRMPWVQGAELLAMHKYYANLRSALIPYIYSSARESTITSVPLMRPLVLEFQEDRRCRDVLHEYLLGRDLLVGIYKHEIYLPEGSWKDYWTGKVYEGGQTVEVSWPAERGGALFVRDGAIIPFGPIMQYRRELPLESINLYLVPSSRPTTFALYEDDGVTFHYLNGEFTLTEISLRQEGKRVQVTIPEAPKSAVKHWELTVALPAAPVNVTCNGTPLETYRWDGERCELHVAVQPGETMISL